ncbi:hypothetical protein QZH47_10065 [Pseudomonas corrugata]
MTNLSWRVSLDFKFKHQPAPDYAERIDHDQRLRCCQIIVGADATLSSVFDANQVTQAHRAHDQYRT